MVVGLQPAAAFAPAPAGRETGKLSFKFGDPAQIRLFDAAAVRAALVAASSPIILPALLFVGAGAFELRHFGPKEFGELKIEIYKLG